MTLDEILDEYEGMWRRAAVEDTPRWPTAGGVCAMSVADGAWSRFSSTLVKATGSWTCQECHRSVAVSVAEAAIHLFDQHHWTWDMFANKFRDALAEGRLP